MSRDVLNQNLVVRISQSQRDLLWVSAMCEDMTVGSFVRRAIQREIDSPNVRALDPYAELPVSEGLQHLHDAVNARQGPEALESFTLEIGDDLVDVLDAGFQTLDCLHDESQHLRFARAAGYLQQLSLSVLRAASRVRALRAVNNYDDYPAPRVEAAETVEG